MAWSKALGGTDITQGATVVTTHFETLVDPNTNTVQSVPLEQSVVESGDSAVTQTVDVDTDLGGTGIFGSATSSAGGDAASTTLTITEVDVVESSSRSSVGVGVDSSAIEWQSIRFEEAAPSREIQVSVDYLLDASITGSAPTGISASAISAVVVFDGSSFAQFGEDDLFLYGFADALVYEIAFGTVLDGSLNFNAMTNSDYLAAGVSIGVTGTVQTALDLTMTALADPVFTVADAGVEVVRSIVPVAVPEPGTLGLLGLGVVVLGFLRRPRVA